MFAANYSNHKGTVENVSYALNMAASRHQSIGYEHQGRSQGFIFRDLSRGKPNFNQKSRTFFEKKNSRKFK